MRAIVNHCAPLFSIVHNHTGVVLCQKGYSLTTARISFIPKRSIVFGTISFKTASEYSAPIEHLRRLKLNSVVGVN